MCYVSAERRNMTRPCDEPTRNRGKDILIAGPGDESIALDSSKISIGRALATTDESVVDTSIIAPGDNLGRLRIGHQITRNEVTCFS